jgi:hypothetical protein
MSTGGSFSFWRSESGIRHSTPSVSGFTPGGRGVGTPGLIGSLLAMLVRLLFISDTGWGFVCCVAVVVSGVAVVAVVSGVVEVVPIVNGTMVLVVNGRDTVVPVVNGVVPTVLAVPMVEVGNWEEAEGEAEDSWLPLKRNREVGERGMLPRAKLCRRLAVEEGGAVTGVEVVAGGSCVN